MKGVCLLEMDAQVRDSDRELRELQLEQLHCTAAEGSKKRTRRD